MEGAARRRKDEIDLAFWQAWHTEAFARMKGHDFKGALKRHFEDKTPSRHAQALAFFHRMKASGADVTITKNQIN